MMKAKEEVVWGDFVMSALLYMKVLSSDLYSSPGASLAEVWRNAACACMPKDLWKPGNVHVEISLIKDHPLAPGTTSLEIFDRGTGFTKPGIDQFCHMGPDNSAGRQAGASQKQVGKLAGLSLNENCSAKEDPTTGFYILTRTSDYGDVTLVSMIPELLYKNRGRVVGESISPKALELGRLRGVRGSFTVIVIPNSVFKTEQEIVEAVKWRLPRRPGQGFKTFLVGGKQVVAPPLATKLVIPQQNGQLVAHLERTVNPEDPNSGVWFADSETGMRVADGSTMSRHIPHPLYGKDVSGDIFIPRTLANQDTSRTGFSKSFLTSKFWTDQVKMFLLGQVVKPARELIGDENRFGSDKVSVTVREVVDMFSSVWGTPQIPLTGPGVLFDFAEPQPGVPRGVRGPYTKNGGPSGPTPEKDPVRSRVLPMQIDGEVWYLSTREMEEWVLAEVNTSAPDSRIIWVNKERYIGLEKKRPASRIEHTIIMLLAAVGRAKYPKSHDQIMKFVVQKRAEMLNK